MRLFKGLGSIESISSILDSYDLKRVLIVSGKKSFRNSGAGQILKKILAKYEVTIFNDFENNPKLLDVYKGLEIAEKNNIQIIIGVGGGSVLDMSKLIKSFFRNSSIALEALSGKVPLQDSKIPLIAIPTTAGTGSEETHFAVVYNENIKYSLAADFLRPNFVILDGKLSLSGSRYQKACNVLDAMSQCIESAWAVNSNEDSKKIAFKALDECMKYSFDFVNEKNDKQKISQKMLEASNLSGKAINFSKTTAAHAWSYAFTSFFNLPHGHAVWMTLPRIFKIHSYSGNSYNDPRGEKYLLQIIDELMNLMWISNASSIEKYFDKFLNSIGIDVEFEKIESLSIKKRIELSKSANIERMKNNPVNFSQQQIEYIFQIK